MKRTFWVKLTEFPPIVCRLLARIPTETGGVRAMTAVEIADRAGISEMEVNSLSWMTSWDSVPVTKVRAFTEACGVDLTSREKLRVHVAYVRGSGSWKYLKQSPDWRAVYEPMIKAYVRWQTKTKLESNK